MKKVAKQVSSSRYVHVIDVRDGIRPIAERTRLIRETLYRALSANGNPHSRQELSTEVWSRQKSIRMSLSG